MRKTPVVLGVLSIIFGAITAVMSLLAMGLGPFFSKLTQFTSSIPGQTELQRAQLEASQASFTHITGYLTVSSAVFLVMSIALVVVGVGLYRRRAWARRATVAWALAGIVLVVGNCIFSVAWLQPHQRQWQHEIYAAHGVTPPFELGAASQIAMVLFSTLMYCAFPTVLLALIGRRSAVNDLLPAA
jgi:hypothetical protein